MVDSVNNKFIHFGCWNKGFCNENDGINALSKVTYRLRKYIEENKVDFISIAGDNYYPSKVDCSKSLINNDFESGFNCLPKDIPKYVIYGNHDIEDILNNEKCKTLDYQLEKYKEKNKFIFFNDVFTYKNYTNFIIIFIDTTLYTIGNNTKINDTCYRNLFDSFLKDDKKIKDLIEHQNNKIIELINDNENKNKRIIIIGHHPLVSVKVKGNVKKRDFNHDLIHLFSNDIFISKQIYYLCADTHYYQESLIEIKKFDESIMPIKINQYIVGTGGAELDNPPEDQYLLMMNDNIVIDNFMVVYVVIKSVKNHGFITFSVNYPNFYVDFIEVFDYDDKNNLKNGGNDILYKNKYLKYKNKYLKLKY